MLRSGCRACEWLASLPIEQRREWFYGRAAVPVLGICDNVDVCCRAQAAFGWKPEDAKKFVEIPNN